MSELTAPAGRGVDGGGDVDAIQYKSAVREPLPWWDNDPTRDARGRFRGQWAPDGLCDRVGCNSRRHGRFCAEHRREHGERLMGQLQAIIDNRNAPLAAVGVPADSGEERTMSEPRCTWDEANDALTDRYPAQTLDGDPEWVHDMIAAIMRNGIEWLDE